MRYRPARFRWEFPTELLDWIMAGGLWPRIQGWAIYPGGRWIMNRDDEWWELA